MTTNYKDQKFYAAALQEILDVGKVQRKLQKEHGGKKVFNIDGALAELLGFCATYNNGK